MLLIWIVDFILQLQKVKIYVIMFILWSTSFDVFSNMYKVIKVGISELWMWI